MIGTPLCIPEPKMVEFKDAMALNPPKYNHYESFIHACMGDGTTESPFSISGELTQVLNLGTIAEYLNVDLEFDPIHQTLHRQRRSQRPSRRPASPRRVGRLL
jgi:hypothetical protein